MSNLNLFNLTNMFKNSDKWWHFVLSLLILTEINIFYQKNNFLMIQRQSGSIVISLTNRVVMTSHDKAILIVLSHTGQCYTQIGRAHVWTLDVNINRSSHESLTSKSSLKSFGMCQVKLQGQHNSNLRQLDSSSQWINISESIIC